MNRYSLLSLITILLVGSFVGCGGDPQSAVAMRRNSLSKLHDAYHSYFEQEKRSPSTAKELADFMKSQSPDDDVVATAVKRLEDLEILMSWDAAISPDQVENNKYVLGFEADCQGSGGYLVMGGGKVDHISGRKFGSMTLFPKAESASDAQPSGTVETTGN